MREEGEGPKAKKEAEKKLSQNSSHPLSTLRLILDFSREELIGFMSALSAARGVSQVMNRCEDAKSTGFLDLSDCSLMYIADAIYLVLRGCQINRCSLKNNNLKKFPLKLIKNFPEMDVINLEGNQLEELPPEIGELAQLRGINVAKNRLTKFPEPLFQCKRLALLDLSDNLINELDIEAVERSFPDLRQFHLRECPIDETKVKAIQAKMGPKCQIVHK